MLATVSTSSGQSPGATLVSENWPLASVSTTFAVMLIAPSARAGESMTATFWAAALRVKHRAVDARQRNRHRRILTPGVSSPATTVHCLGVAREDCPRVERGHETATGVKELHGRPAGRHLPLPKASRDKVAPGLQSV